MEEHKAGLGTKLFQCETCKAKFHYRTQLRKHLSYKGDSDSTLCSNCGESFNNKCELKVHKKIHSKEKKYYNPNDPKYKAPKKCFYCDLVCETPSKAMKHMWRAHDHMAIFCDICGHKACGKSDLARHLDSHNEGLQSECEQCGKMFKGRYNVERHIKVVHTSDAQKKFKCTQCGKGFTTLKNLENHMNMHLGLKPYKCECGAAYQNASNLLAHRKKSCKINLNNI